MDSQDEQEKSFRIVNIEFEGVKRTRPTVLARIVADLFASKSLSDCMQRSHQVGQKLGSLVSSVNIRIDPVDVGQPDHVITFVVQERGRATVKSRIEADNQAATYFNVELAAPNLNGIGDSLGFSLKSNNLSKTIPVIDFEYKLPLAPWRTLYNPVYSIVFGRYMYPSLPSGYDQENKSITNQVEFYSHPHLRHSLGLISTWTHIKASSDNTPIEIREQAGHFLKTYLRYGIQYDTREGGNFPICGTLAKMAIDLKKGARFARHEAQLQFNKLILPQYGLLGQLKFFTGTYIDDKNTNISDRFFPGGVPTFRGFERCGLGPSVDNRPLGVTSYLTAGLHLYPILPATSPDSWLNNYIRPHFFVNLGTAGDLTGLARRLTSQDSLKRETNLLMDSMRYSFGFGLVAFFGPIQLEFNYCPLIIKKGGDITVDGLQKLSQSFCPST